MARDRDERKRSRRRDGAADAAADVAEGCLPIPDGCIPDGCGGCSLHVFALTALAGLGLFLLH